MRAEHEVDAHIKAREFQERKDAIKDFTRGIRQAISTTPPKRREARPEERAADGH